MDAVTQQGHDSINKGSKSFGLAARFLPADVRDDAVMLYAWCRYADDLIDGQVMGHGQLDDYRVGQADRLDLLRTKTQEALDGKSGLDPIFAGLQRVVQRRHIPHQHPHELIKGFEMDVSERVYTTVDDVLDYSYHVAGVVGVMMARIMGVSDDATLDRASDLGLAFQLTNIARDVVDDAKAGRVFVPSDLLTRHHASTDPSKLADPSQWADAHKAALDLLDVAENYYASAQVGIKELPFRSAWAISAASNIYRAIGTKLRQGGPRAWDGRVHTSKPEKAGLAFGALGKAMRRTSVKPVSRDGLYTRPAL